ncbi:hypothetical protein [Demetria terragena]|uniref:hypothetical protein n=1 Tax=Demetria terragena TaxID=63959 RepID=UPI000372791E|nr:hypothetical protein [Demetria terragena]
MRRTIAILATTAALAGGMTVTATSSSACHGGPAPVPSASSSTATSLEKATKALQKKTGEEHVTVVAGKGFSGQSMYFGMVIDQDNQATFWERDGSTWTITPGRAPVPLPTSIDTCDLGTEGVFVDGVTYPVFIVQGRFDSVGAVNAVAVGYNKATDAWGPLLGSGEQLWPASHFGLPPHLDGAEISYSVEDGELVTRSLWGTDDPTYDELRQQIADPILRTWSGNGDEVLTMRSETGGPTD